MSVAHDTAVESHTGTAGSASQASFDISITPSVSVAGILVFTFVNANADNATSVKINPAGANVDVPVVTGGRAVDTATEAGDCKAWFLGSGLPAGGSAWTVRVNRTNNANVMYAVVITVTASGNTEVFDVVLKQENQALNTTAATHGEEGIHNGSNVTAVRYAGINSGLTTHPAAGANSTELASIEFTTLRSVTVVRETTAGTGSRYVGFNAATDDVAAVYLCVREVVSETPDITFDCLISPMTPDADGTLLTSQILRAANVGAGDQNAAANGFTLTGASGTPPNANITKESLQTNQGPINAIRIVNQGIISASAPFKTIGVNHAFNSMYFEQDLSQFAKRICTVAGVVYVDFPDQGGSGSLWDLYGFFGSISGEFAMMQFATGSGSGQGYGFEIETNPGGVTTHSSTITVTTGALYWFSFTCNYTSGTASLYIYNYPAMTLVGSVTKAQTTGEDIGHTRAGNGEVAVATGTHKSYFWAGLDWTSAVSPLKFTVAGKSIPPMFHRSPRSFRRSF
jgi:hypothetical protein